MKPALLLNSDWTPIKFVTPLKAINLLYSNKVEIVSLTDGLSVWDEGYKLVNGNTFPAGATIRLLKYVQHSYNEVKYRRKVVFNRDNWQCQYCGIHLTKNSATIDHIMPASRGGERSWLNCITSCGKCNRKKRNRTPDEAGMKLQNFPKIPTIYHYLDRKKSSTWHPDWIFFFKDLK